MVEMRKFLMGLLGILVVLGFPAFSFAQINNQSSNPEIGTERSVSDADPFFPGIPDNAKIVPEDFVPLPESTGINRVSEAFAPMPYPVPETRLPFGQSHFYSITLRGNGEALFSLKMVFSNKEEASKSSMMLTFPSEPQNLSVYQAFSEPECISYRPMIDPLRAANPVPSDLMLRYPYSLKQDCEQYQEPDYLYGWGTTSYHKAEYSMNGREITVTLPKAVKPGGGGSLVFSFLLDGVTSKDMLGAYDFSVMTVTVADTIQNLQAGVTVDPDYYLKDALGAINYQTKEMSSMAPSLAMDSGRSVGKAQFDQFYNSIGQGTVVKTATNLQPNESFTVAGTYADSKWKLYGREIGIGVGVFVLVLLVALGILFFVVKKVFGKMTASPAQAKSAASFSYITVLGASFGSSLLIFLYTLGLYFISFYLSHVFPYYHSNNFFYPLFILLLGVISLCIYAALLFAPGIVIGIKRGVVAASATLVLTIFWLVFFGVVFAGIFFLFFQDKTMTDYPVPYRGGVFMKNGVAAPSEPSAIDQ